MYRIASELNVILDLACVAGRRKGVRRVKMSLCSRASCARLSPFPPLRTPATQARKGRSALADKIAIVQGQFCCDNFCLVRCVRIDIVIKPSNCVVGWWLACLKNFSILNSQSVSLQHVDSQTGHHKGGHSNVLQNSVPYIKGSLPLGFIKSMNH